MDSVINPAGGYRYAPGISPYSAGVLAVDEHVIVRVTLNEPTPWLDGFATIDHVLAAEGRPAQALCAVELRCPTPHSFGGFGSFNDDYREALDERGILFADGTNPVARTNVAPSFGVSSSGAGPEAQTGLHAFSFTADRSSQNDPGSQRRPSFVIAGAGDLNDQSDLRPEAIVGGQTPWAESGPARAAAVLTEMETRLDTLDLSWGNADSVVVYSVERVGEVLETTVLPRLGSVARNGVHWYHARPPIDGLLFEMDTRGGVVERRL